MTADPEYGKTAGPTGPAVRFSGGCLPRPSTSSRGMRGAVRGGRRPGGRSARPAGDGHRDHRARPARAVDRVRAVFVDGFVSFTPLEWRLVEVFARRTELWVGLPAEEGSRADAFPGAEEIGAAYRPRRRESDAASDPAAPGTRTDARPAGLSHLEGHLFGPAVPAASDATRPAPDRGPRSTRRGPARRPADSHTRGGGYKARGDRRHRPRTDVLV